MAMTKHRKDQHSISPSVRRADLHCLLKAQLPPQHPLVLALQARRLIHLPKRRRKRLSLWSRLVDSGKHHPLVFHLVKNLRRVQQRLRQPSNLHSRLQILYLYRHSRLVLRLCLRVPLVSLRQLLRRRVLRRLIGPHHSPLGHLLRRSQQPVRSPLEQGVSLLRLLRATPHFRLERLEMRHLHLVQEQMLQPHLLSVLVPRPPQRHRQEDLYLRWDLHHPQRKAEE